MWCFTHSLRFYTWRWCNFYCWKNTVRKTAQETKKRVFILQKESYTYWHGEYGLLPPSWRTFLSITYLIWHRSCLPLLWAQCSLNHPHTWIQPLGKYSKNWSTQRWNMHQNRSSSKLWLFPFCILGNNINISKYTRNSILFELVAQREVAPTSVLMAAWNSSSSSSLSKMCEMWFHSSAICKIILEISVLV